MFIMAGRALGSQLPINFDTFIRFPRGGVVGKVLALLILAAILIPARPAAGQGPDLDAYPWLYLRDGEVVSDDERLASVIAVGDVMLGRGVAPRLSLGSESGPHPFASVPWLRAADLTLANLECVLTARAGAPAGHFTLGAPPAAVQALRQAGFDVLGLANNHALNYGPQGLAETVARLRMAGMAAVGAGPDSDAAFQPVIREVNGVRLAFLAFEALDPWGQPPDQTGWATTQWDSARSPAAIARAQALADAVIVSVHWGYEYEWRPDPAQRRLAQAMIEAGVDLVIGHHPHVVQGTEVMGQGFVAYSLGNFVFDQQQGETRQGLVLRALFDREGLRAVQALPVHAGLSPRLMTPADAIPLLARVQPDPPRLGYACSAFSPAEDYDCEEVEVPRETRSGHFTAGSLDLTGDGLAEGVRLVAERVTVSRDGVDLWTSPAEWRVVDLALGDPDDDGRGDMLLAFWRADAEGAPRNHPFVVGYRQGMYRTLWGGSAVADPILEVELGDLDGDGVQELVVLEGAEGGRSAVTVWRWHGWGFSLLWRGPAGYYRDVTLVPGEGGRAVISVAAGLDRE